MKKIKKFWNNRVDKYGHTGWYDSSVYAYDQQARLIVVDKILKSLTLKKSIALDFGSGSGDFSSLLSKHFSKVFAFDISDVIIKKAIKKYKKARTIQFCSGNFFENSLISDSKMDLILSVTVLDHIVNDCELEKTLKYFHSILNDSGVVIAFEYSLKDKKKNNDYQRFMKFDEWCAVFSASGFLLKDYYGFYHPIEKPCDSYLLYKNCVTNKILNLISKYFNFPMINNLRNILARKYLRKWDFLLDSNKEDSLIKIMIFEKNKAGGI